MKNQKKIKIGFAGGGTGGHIYPILAVHESLKDSDHEDYEFVYFVSEGKPEEKIAQENNIKAKSIPCVGGMPRSAKAITWIFNLLKASFKAYSTLAQERPNIVFATGGYSAAPVLMAANWLKIPYVIHNLDAHLGLANLVFIKNSLALTLGMPLTVTHQEKDENKIKINKILFKLFPTCPKNGSVIITGNPVRKEFYSDIESKEKIFQTLGFHQKRKTLTIIGGSQGAQAINEAVLRVVEDLISDNWQIIHQLGPLQYEQFEIDFPKSPFYKPYKYLNNLHEIYAISDLAISRAGAMSLAELSAKELPCLLIPLPSSAQNHQFHNAKILETQGCALVLEQAFLNEVSLKENIENIYKRRHLMKLGFNNLGSENQNQKNAAQLISEIIKEAIQ